MLRTQASLLLALALAACASAKTYTYTLSAVPPAGGPVVSHPLASPIEVGEVGIPAVIDRTSIVLTAPGDQLQVSQNDVWGAGLRDLIRRTLSEDLAERLPDGSVLQPGTPARSARLRIVAVAIQQFEGSTGGVVTLRADWTVVRSGETPKGKPHHADIQLNAAGGTVPAIVPAMSAALGQLADEIARSVS